MAAKEVTGLSLRERNTESEMNLVLTIKIVCNQNKTWRVTHNTKEATYSVLGEGEDLNIPLGCPSSV